MKKIILIIFVIIIQGCSSTEKDSLDLNMIAGSIIATGVGNTNDFQSFEISPFYKEDTKSNTKVHSESMTTTQVKHYENGSITNSRTVTNEKIKTKSSTVGFGIF